MNLALSQEETKTVSKTISPYFGKSFSLKNSFGNITIAGTDKNDVSIVAKISSKNDDAKKIVDDIEIEIKEGSLSIDVKTIIPKYLTKDVKDFKIDYTISLPEKTYLMIDNRFGNTNIKNISYKVNMQNTFGNLNVENCISSNKITSEFGAVVLKNIGEGSDITNKFGEITIDGAEGNVSIVIKFGKCNVKNINGNIEISTGFSSVSIENIKGNVNIKKDKFSSVLTENIAGKVSK
jgi:hypothetical protein